MRDVEVRFDDGWAGVYAARAFYPGECVLSVSGNAREEANRYSIQVDIATHVHPTEDGWKYLNHSCRPNLAFSTKPFRFEAVRPISHGEELSFNYLTTEWEMASDFACRCGSSGCYGMIAGFKHLPGHLQRELLPRTAPHIQKLFSRITSVD